MNPAKRILNVANAIQTHKQPSNEGLSAWTSICARIYGNKKDIDQHAITSIFAALNDEVDLLVEELTEKDIPKAIYSPYLNRFRATLQPVSLAKPWSESAKQMDSNTVNILQWIALYLGEQEDPIEQSDLDELVSNLRAIDAIIAEPGLPRTLKRTIKSNIDAIWQAIDLYPIHGSASIENAIKRAAGDLTFNQAEIESALTSEQDATRTAAVSLLQVIKDTVTLFNGTVKSGENILKIGNTVSDLLKLP